jgi:Ca2+-binding RTX toxin-like protein
VNDDPSTADCNENLLLLRQPDGTIQYRAINAIDPPGINGQSVYNGTKGADRINGGNDNDTFWGGPGNDRIEGNGGDDVAYGGEGNDIITDLSGADVPKGGPGNDAIDAGPGDDIILGGDGQDFLNGGANDNETFAGPGNDFIIAGQGADAVFGDGGDDWIEGGTGQDLLQGDHGAPFFDDPGQTKPGNDIFIGQPGENDYDAEGGDDIMSQNPAIDRNAGAAGFDWAIHQYDTIPADDDLMINQGLVGLGIQLVVNRDRWQETEADSGSNLNDVMHGDNLERVVGPGGFAGCDALDPTGVARIAGLDRLVSTFPSSLADVIDASAMKQCPLVGFGGVLGNLRSGTVWAEGNILIGGGGNDVLEGRGNNDIIDGDHMLRVRISVRTDPANPATEIGSTDLMEHPALSGNFGPGATPAMTLQQAVFAGLVDPGNLVAVRELVSPDGSAMAATANRGLASDCPAATADPADVNGAIGSTVKPGAATNCDTAAYSLPASNYTITPNKDGSVTVADNGSVAIGGVFAKGDGIDTLWNIENLRFCVSNDPVTLKCTASKDQPVPTFVPPPAPLAAISTAPLTLDLAFGTVNVGSTSTTQTVTIGNVGNAPLTVSGATAGNAQFVVSNHCTAPVTPGNTCTIDVAFAPTGNGPVTTTLSIVHNGSTSPSIVDLSGTGFTPAIPVASVLPGSLAFGSVVVNSAGVSQVITVSNTGNAPLAVSGVGITGANANQFGITNGCTSVVPAGSCSITVRFAPTSAGAKAASVVITHNSNNVVGSVSTVPITGTGTTVGSLPRLSIATSVAFGTQRLNNTKTVSVQLNNQGPGVLQLGTVTVSGAPFTVSRGDCGATIAAGRSCKLSVTFRPTSAGAITGMLTVNSNAVNNPTTATLTGTGR